MGLSSARDPSKPLQSHRLRDAARPGQSGSGPQTMKKSKVLVVEDEPDIAELVRYNLERDAFEVVTAGHGEDGLRLARGGGVDVILLDIMLPGIDGLEVLRRLKAEPVTRSIPVILLTSKSEENDIVVGLGIGADDYVTKPFSPRELAARVKANLRRRQMAAENTKEKVVSLEGLEIDPIRFRVTVDGHPVPFTLAEFRLLHFLACHAGRVFTRSDLLPHVVGEGVFVIDRNIDVHIRNVRKKLQDRAHHVVTIRGVGYKFES